MDMLMRPGVSLVFIVNAVMASCIRSTDSFIYTSGNAYSCKSNSLHFDCAWEHMFAIEEGPMASLDCIMLLLICTGLHELL